MMSMEHTTIRDLLTEHLMTRYKGKHVLVIFGHEDATDAELSALKEALDKFGMLPPDSFWHPGIIIIEPTPYEQQAQAITSSLINRFGKTSFRMESYTNGECINENY